MKSDTVVHCSKCQKPLVPGIGFVRSKIPGKEAYEFFHRRFLGGDCWDAYLKEGHSS